MNKAQVYFTKVLKFLAIAIVALPVILFVFVSPSLAAAGINKTINFQGKVVNKTAGTNVTNGTYTMIFSIYDKPSGGTALWSETDSTVQVTDGIFRVALGAGTAFPAGMNWNQNGLFLDVTFNGEQMGTRVQLTSVPYAFNAGQVDGLTVQDSTSGASSTSATLKLGDATTPKTFDLGTNNLTFTTSGTTTLTLPTSGTVTALGNTTTGSGSTLVLASNPSFAGITLSSGGISLGGTTSDSSHCIVGGATAAWGSCGGGGGVNWWNQLGGVISPVNTNYDFALGGTATSSALFSFTGIENASHQTIASISGKLIVMPNTGYGNVGINTATPVYPLDVAGDTNLSTGSVYRINGTSVLSGSTLGAGVTSSGLTSVGTLTSLTMGGDLTLSTHNIITDATTGTKIGTATTQKIGFYNQTPVVQPSGDILTALGTTSGLGLISSPTISQADVTGLTTGSSPSFAGETLTGDLTLSTHNIITDTTTGTKFGTATNQKLAFFNSTPIVQPTSGTNVITALNSLGLVPAGVLAKSDVGLSAVENTALSTWAGSGNITTVGTLTTLSSGAITTTGTFALNAAGGITTNQTSIPLLNATATTINFGGAATTMTIGGSGGTLTVGNGGNWTETTGSNGNYNLTTGGSGKVGIYASSPLANLDIRQDTAVGATSGTVATASVSGSTSFAGLVVNNSGVGDIFTASKSGATKFRITNRGSILFQGDILTSIGSLINEGAAPSQTNQSAVVNAIGDQGSLVPNAGFESTTVANKITNIADQNLVDGWVAAATNSAVITRVATDSAKGTASLMIKLNASQNTAVYSVCMPLATSIASGYNLNMYAKASQVVGVMIRGYLDTYTTQANCQNDTSRTTTTATPVGTATTTSYAVVPNIASAFAAISNSKWSRVHIFIGCAANCTTGTIINIDGVRLIENTSTNGVDYAENYQGDPNNLAQPGDVISLTQVDGKTVVVPSSKYQDKSTIGVVSTNPGYVLDDAKTPDPEVAVALAGRIPTKVSSKNGPIEVGDSLTSSDIPGVAVKAKGSGQIIGNAMEIWDDPNPENIGSVTMFVKNSYSNGEPQFTLTQDNSQDVLAALEDQQASVSAQSTETSTLSIDQIAANIQIVSPKITVDELFAKRIVAGQIDGLDVEGINNRLAALENKVATLSAALTTTPAPQSSDSALMDKENELIDKISQNLQSATQSATEPQGTLSLSSLNSNGLTTLPGSLHVQGNGLFEGILTILDTLTTNNFIVNGASTFFGDALFKGNVNFEKSPTFSSDTGGFARIVKGTSRVEVQFDNQFENDPVVNAQVSFDEKQDDQGNIVPTDDLEKSYFSQGYKFIVVNRNKKGFTIVLNKNTGQDVNFTWTAIQVKDAKTIQSRLPD